MKRILVWYLDNIKSDNISQGPVYYMESDYELGGISIYARNAPHGGDLQLDIRDDGVSILESYAALHNGDNLEEDAENYPKSKPTIEEGSLVSCYVIGTNGASDITVQLELIGLADESEEGTKE